MHDCRPSDFPGIHCLREYSHDVDKELRRRWPELEIIYDRSTCRSADAPGFHVYKHNGDGTLRLVASCQQDDLQIWPEGNPIMPGLWLIAVLQKQFSPHPSAIAEAWIRHLAHKRRGAEMKGHFIKECATYSTAGVNKDSVGTKLSRKARAKVNRTGKVQARVNK